MSQDINEKLQDLLMELQESKAVINSKNDEITDLNHKLAELEYRLTEISNSRVRLYSILSHDLRSPFNGLLGFTNFLKEEADSLTPDEIKTFTENISSSAKGLLDLIDTVFEWVKMDTGKYDYLPAKIDLKYIADEVFFLFSKKAEEKEILLTNEIPPDTSAYGDHELIRRVIEHLISNAIKYTSTSGKVKVYVSDAGKNIELAVKDNGTGLTHEDMEKLFRTDIKFSNRGTSNEKGFGLGLIISKKIMEVNKGSIRVESEGNGSTFIITLPKEGNS